MTTISPAQIISKRIDELKREGVSQREIEKRSRVSRKTITRYLENDFPSDSSKPERLINYLFDDQVKQTEVMELIESFSKKNKSEVSLRRVIRREMTEASQAFDCKIGMVLIKDFGEEWNRASEKVKNEKGEFKFEDYLALKKKIDLEEQFTELEVYADFFYKKVKADNKAFRISSRNGLEFLFDVTTENLVHFKDEDMGERIKQWILMCRNNHVTLRGVVALTQKKLATSDLFSREREKQFIIDDWLMSSWKSSIERAIRYEKEGVLVEGKDGKPRYNKTDRKAVSSSVINALRDVHSDMQYFSNQHRSLKNGQAKLLLQLQSILKQLS